MYLIYENAVRNFTVLEQINDIPPELPMVGTDALLRVVGAKLIFQPKNLQMMDTAWEPAEH